MKKSKGEKKLIARTKPKQKKRDNTNITTNY